MSNLIVRTLTALVAAPLLIGALFVAPPWVFAVLGALTALVAATELGSMVAPQHTALRRYLVIASLTVHLLWAHLLSDRSLGGYPCIPDFPLLHTLPLLAPVVLTVFGALISMTQVLPMATASTRMGWMIAGPWYAGALPAILVLLHQQPHGASWVLLAMLLAWLGDTGGYFAGKMWGRRPIARNISPNKTVAGSLGGTAGSLLGALLVHLFLLPHVALVPMLILGLVASYMGQWGDLVVSVIKRSSGVKDTGRIIPGHGGLLDRIDALLLTGFTTWIFVQVMYSTP